MWSDFTDAWLIVNGVFRVFRGFGVFFFFHSLIFLLRYWFWHLLSMIMFMRLILCLKNWFCYRMVIQLFCEKIKYMISNVFGICVFLFIRLSFLVTGLCDWQSICKYLGKRDNLIVVCRKRELFLLCGVVRVRWMGEILSCVFVGGVSIISSFTKCDGVWMSCCVIFEIR